jgi:N-acetyl sugar amidotransferase
MCVISNQRPSSTVEFKNAQGDSKQRIKFDDLGVCSACNFHKIKDLEIDWTKRNRDLEILCDKYRKNSGYDVVVPGSGGKDSAFTAHILKYKYGMNPLTVTWAPHLYTNIGWKNFQNWIQVGGLDNLLFTPNGKLHRILTREAFLNLLHPFQPFIVGQRIIGPLISTKFKIPLVMYGENQAEYGNDISENSTPKMQSKFYSDAGNNIKLSGKTINEIISKYNFSLKDFEPYLPVVPSEIETNKTEVHYLGYYLKWDPQECFYYAVENTGFIPNDTRTEGSYSKYSSIDDKIDPFHYYTTLVKFGLGRASYDASQEIRNGKISRDEAVNLVKLYDLEFPEKYFDDFLNYISIDKETFFNTIDSFRPKHIWNKKNNNWELNNPVWRN